MILAEMEDTSSTWHQSNFIDEVFQLSNEYDEGLFGRKHKKKTMNDLDNMLSFDDAMGHLSEWTLSVLGENSSVALADNLIVPANNNYSLQDIEECLMNHANECNSGDQAVISIKCESEATQSDSALQDTFGMLQELSSDFPDFGSQVPEIEMISSVIEGNTECTNDLGEQAGIRKKPVSQALAWYQNSRKRKLSLSSGFTSRTRNSSVSLDLGSLKGKSVSSADINPTDTTNDSGKENTEPDSSVSKSVALSCSDMEVYSRIPSTCLSNEGDVLTTQSLTVNVAQSSSSALESIDDMLPEGISVHDVDSYLWDINMQNIFEDDEACVQYNPSAEKQNCENLSVDKVKVEAVKIEPQYNVDLEQVKSEPVTLMSSKCELPSDCVTFPDEIFSDSFTNFDECLPGGLSYLNMGDVLREADTVRRRPGRPRKKSLSQSVAWYRSHRKRQTSISNSSITVTLSSSSREHSWDDSCVSSERLQSNRCSVKTADSTTPYKKVRKTCKVTRKSKPVVNRRRAPKKLSVHSYRHSSWDSSSNEVNYQERDFSSTTISYESDDDDAIVDVVTISGGDACSIADAKSYLPLIHAFHNYCSTASVATQRVPVKDISNETKFKLVWSPERYKSASSVSAASCPSSTSRSSATTSCSSSSRYSKQRSLLSSTSRSSSNRRSGYHGRKHGGNDAANEQRSKREALNDLERQRRREMTREITALRVVVPGVRENARSAKVSILNAASNHIRMLERTLVRNKTVLAAELQRNAQLKARLAASPSR